MDLDGLGDRCSLSSCRKLDFLPLKCPHCTLVFCSTHYPHTLHACAHPPPSTHVPTCPVCSRAVPQGGHASLDAAMSAHIDRGCPARPRENARCAKPGCRRRDVAPVTCRACGETFCVEHRLEADHDCKRDVVQAVEDGAPSLAAAMRKLVAKDGGEGVDGRGRRVAAQEGKKNSLTRRLRSKSRSAGRAESGGGGGGGGSGAVSASAKASGSSGSRTVPVVGATASAFVNSPSNPRRAGTAAIESDDAMHLAVYFCGEARRRPEYWVVSRRWSAGKVLDAFKLPQPDAGRRYALYAVKKAGDSVTGVNLLPRISPLRENGREVVADGDCVVVELGDDGLREGWVEVLGKDRALSKFKSTRISASSASKAKCIVV